MYVSVNSHKFRPVFGSKGKKPVDFRNRFSYGKPGSVVITWMDRLARIFNAYGVQWTNPHSYIAGEKIKGRARPDVLTLK